jgi:hypothetical protein
MLLFKALAQTYVTTMIIFCSSILHSHNNVTLNILRTNWFWIILCNIFLNFRTSLKHFSSWDCIEWFVSEVRGHCQRKVLSVSKKISSSLCIKVIVNSKLSQNTNLFYVLSRALFLKLLYLMNSFPLPVLTSSFILFEAIWLLFYTYKSHSVHKEYVWVCLPTRLISANVKIPPVFDCLSPSTTAVNS